MDFPIAVRPPEPSAAPAPIVLRHLAPAKVSEVYESYWRFAAERQAVFFRRASGEVLAPDDSHVLTAGDTLVLSGLPEPLALAEAKLLKG